MIGYHISSCVVLNESRTHPLAPHVNTCIVNVKLCFRAQVRAVLTFTYSILPGPSTSLGLYNQTMILSFIFLSFFSILSFYSFFFSQIDGPLRVRLYIYGMIMMMMMMMIASSVPSRHSNNPNNSINPWHK